MKLDALEHPKILDFAARLGVTRPTALGHLELLWAFTGKHAPQGDIGKWPDGAIARACDYMGDPNLFLQSLLQSGLIDANAEHRYLIHDWPEHAPRWVRAKLAKAKQDFISISRTVVRSTVATTDETSDDDSEDCSGFSVSEVKSSEEKSLSRSELTSGNKQQQPEPKITPEAAMAIPLREAGVKVTSIHPTLVAWVQDGYTLQQLQGALAIAREAKGEDVPIHAKYLDTVLRDPKNWPAINRQKPPNGNGKHDPPQRSVDERENEIIVRAIRDGLTDAQISGLEDLAIAPDLPRRIRALRKEVQREQH